MRKLRRLVARANMRKQFAKVNKRGKYGSYFSKHWKEYIGG